VIRASSLAWRWVHIPTSRAIGQRVDPFDDRADLRWHGAAAAEPGLDLDLDEEFVTSGTASASPRARRARVVSASPRRP
jgi:hypothetical protein